MEIENKIRSFIDENLTVFEDDVAFSDQDNIFQLGYVNSLFAMKLLNFIESEYNIKIENLHMNIESFSSVGNITSLIKKYKS